MDRLTAGLSAQKIRVLHVAETIRGGIATYFNELHPYQCSAFGEGNVHYIVPAVHRCDLNIDDANIDCFHRTGRNPLSLYGLAKVTLDAIQRLRPNIVHLHSSFAGLVIRPLIFALGYPVRVVYCPHGWSFSRDAPVVSTAAARFAERLLSFMTDRIICISHSEFQNALCAGIHRHRLVLIRSGITTARPVHKQAAPASWAADAALRVLFIGRLDRQKGYDLLLAAALQLGSAVNVRLVGSAVVGDKAATLELPPNVSLLGWLTREEIETQLDLADLVVIPSRWEAFGMVTLEAMRAKKPVVAFAVGALPEIIEDGRTGILCEPANVASLVQGLQMAASWDLEAVGQAGQDRLKRFFDVERTHAMLVAAYEHALGGTSRPAKALTTPVEAQK